MPPFFYFEPQTGVVRHSPIRSNFYIFRLEIGKLSHVKKAIANATLRDEGLVYSKEFLEWLNKNDTKWDQQSGLSRSLEEVEDRMVDYMWNGTVDGDVYDGDPADLDFFGD